MLGVGEVAVELELKGLKRRDKSGDVICDFCLQAAGCFSAHKAAVNQPGLDRMPIPETVLLRLVVTCSFYIPTPSCIFDTEITALKTSTV